MRHGTTVALHWIILAGIPKLLTSYDKAVTLNPYFTEVWINRGNTLVHLGRYSEAVASYEKAIALNPDDAVAWNNHGVVLEYLARYAEAVDSYDKAITLNPDYAMHGTTAETHSVNSVDIPMRSTPVTRYLP